MIAMTGRELADESSLTLRRLAHEVRAVARELLPLMPPSMADSEAARTVRRLAEGKHSEGTD